MKMLRYCAVLVCASAAWAQGVTGRWEARYSPIDEARKVIGLARPRWDRCEDSRKIRIDSLTFVKGNGERWMDLATIPLEGKKAK